MPTLPHFTSGYAPVEGGQLYYEAAGEGRAIVLIHAGVADLRMWDAVMPLFAARHRVIRYDARGFGRTKSENVSMSNRDDIRDLLNHLGVDRAAMIGVSRGGQIATDFTLEYPDRVWALIPTAAGLGGFDYQPTPEENAAYEQSEKLYESRDIPALIDLEIALWLVGQHRPPSAVAPELFEKMSVMLRDTYAFHTTEHFTPRPLTPPAAERLGEIRVPTLVVASTGDTSDTVQAAEYMATHIAGAKKIIYPTVAHMIPMEIPDQFAADVLAFLASIA